MRYMGVLDGHIWRDHGVSISFIWTSDLVPIKNFNYDMISVTETYIINLLGDFWVLNVKEVMFNDEENKALKYLCKCQ